MSLIGFRAQNHTQQVSARGAVNNVDDRETDDRIWETFHERFNFTVDAAADHHNAKLPRYFTRQTDGLAQSWTGERVWCNPPYSDIEPWIRKSWHAIEDERAELVVMLLPANRTEQKWWQDLVEPRRDRPGGGAARRVPARTPEVPRARRATDQAEQPPAVRVLPAHLHPGGGVTA